MKIMKSNFIKKLIIILVIIMVLNTLLPDPVNAGILSTFMNYAGGVLFKPLAMVIGTTLASIDVAISGVLRAGEGIKYNIFDESLYKMADDVLETFLVGPDTIFQGDVEIANANIFSESYTNGSIKNIRTVVARVYYLLRNICGFIMLGGLIFTGIRILLSSNIPTKKTQYLILLQDWLIGMVLLVLSHVLMTGIFYVSDTIVDALGDGLVGLGSLNSQCLGNILSVTNWKYSTLIVNLILLAYLIWMTVVFAISYFKRFLWICVLVVFAPVFAVMYSFGQQTKQIYSRWMREFCLTVFVQPFHMIIYAVLVGIPLKLVSGWTTNAFDIFYALMAISMIRPAEKYMRQLFGMDRGVANMASYDSGKQVITDTAKAIGKVVKTAVAVGATVATAGAAAGAIGAAGAAGAAGSAGSGAAGALGSQGAAGALGEAGEGLSGAGDALSGAGDALGELGSGDANTPGQWITEGWDQDTQGRFLNPYNDEWYTEAELNSGRDLPGYMDQDDFDSADIQALTSGITDGMENQMNNEKAEETYVGPAEFMKSLRENSEAKDENMTDNDVAKAVGSENVAKMLEDAGFSGEEIASYLGTGKENAEGLSGGNINASNVTINASSVNMEGATLESAQSQLQVGEGTISEEGNTTSGDTQNSSEDDGISLEGSSEKINFWDAFKNQGGLEQIGTLANDLMDGHHSLAAGLYVDGTAPTGEWNANSQWRRQNIAEAGKKREENVRRSADNWANNKANISIMAGKYIEEEREKAQKKYGKSKDADYIESVAQEQAKTKAKAALKDMSVYVQYGVTDVNTAYKLYENANNNGFKPDESIRNMAGFNKFNTNAGNVNNINVSNNFTGNNYTSVEQAIPNAKTYYDAGYTNVKDMAWVDYMAQKLNKTPDYAMAVDEALKKKGKGGKLTYNGKDADMKKVIDQINSHYGG